MATKFQVYSIRDTKSDLFHPPFYNHTHGEAERNFQQVANDPKTTISQYPEDFDLYHLGSFDDQTGKITPLDSPVHMLKATAMKRPVQ